MVVEEATAKMSHVDISDESHQKFGRRDHLVQIEHKIQEKWESVKAFESDPDPSKPKYMCSFPYPYMNGFLHIGHGFTITKAEFAGRYHRLKGENVLFPFGFHCTGMPIQAAANKLKKEIEQFGCPPVFPVEEIDSKPVEASVGIPDKSKGKKSKVVAKTGKATRQWNILKMMIPEEEIPKFVDPMHWLRFFPPHGESDLRRFGMNVDWRRSFITTDVNPFYDAFIRWQLNTLKANERVNRGHRPNIFSIADGQICADHDRASGEGVNPQEYTLIKFQAIGPFSLKMTELAAWDVYLVGATLRPETMYGLTNCFVLPEGEYGAFLINDKEVFIMTERAALNLAHQGYSKEWGKIECLMKMKGMDIMGLKLKAPNCPYEFIYTMPLLSISMGKGTGIVASVPSDAPDDYAAVRDLKEKPAFREKFHIKDEMIMPYDVVPIIDVPGFGDQAAVTVCDQLKIKSQNDREKLNQAKELVYLKGFYEGVLIVGPHKGKKVCDAKPLIRAELIESGQAIPYFEPESNVMSRSGDECVVAHLDQWYLTYGDEDWKERVLKHISNPETFTTYNAAVLAEYKSTLEWLREWAPCRQFGLGTKLPWDPQFVVESLSDSTIYMAYYTIAHHLQSSVDGSLSGPHGIKPESLTDEVFNYIFCKGSYPHGCSIAQATLNILRAEFEYWYPLDLRVSGKDLIRNHLTMCLYNHAEIWRDDPSKMPRSFFTNGHVLVDAEKMSKSKGNFLTMRYCADEYSADATRFACADAGDSMDDANFSRETCNMAILRLTNEEDWFKKTLEEIKEGKLRTDGYDFNDNVFLSQMNHSIQATATYYDKMQWREGLNAGFFEYSIIRDTYRDICTRSGQGMHKDVILRFMESQVIMLSPICPHFCEHMWEILGKPGLVCQTLWPTAGPVDYTLLRAADFMTKSLKLFRDILTKVKTKGEKGASQGEEKPTHMQVYLADDFPEWKQKVLKFMHPLFDESAKTFPSDLMKRMTALTSETPEMKKLTKNIMQFAAFVKSEVELRGVEALEMRMPYDQKEVLMINKTYILKSLDLTDLTCYYVGKEDIPNGDAKKMETATPGKPSIRTYVG